MRTPVIAGNWKMNTTLAEATALVEQMTGRLDIVQGVEKVICPPFISLAAVGELLHGTSIGLGAQNCHYELKGAYTGEISATMLSALCEFVILGHSERRQYFGETDELVNRKLRAALGAKLIPILCVGEKLEERQSGRTEEVVRTQVAGALGGVDSPHGLVMAYEPIWAIGTGMAASGEEANLTINLIRGELRRLYGAEMASETRILYGGSVTADNIGEFIAQGEIDGALVGGASLKADEFVSIVEQSAART